MATGSVRVIGLDRYGFKAPPDRPAIPAVLRGRPSGSIKCSARLNAEEVSSMAKNTSQPKPQIFVHQPASTIKGAVAAANAHVANVHAASKK
jgi:hypothetical protein